MFIETSIQKLKPKLQFILTVALAITAVLLISKPLETHATGAMTESDFEGKGATKVIGGANYDRTGYLFYLSYPDGRDASDVRATTSHGPIKDRFGKDLPFSNISLSNRNGHRYKGKMGTYAPWEEPYRDHQGRGEDVKEWLLTPQDGHTRAAILIGDTWGGEWAKKWERKEVYLTFETFFWHHIYVDGKGTGIWACTTTQGWGAIQKGFGMPEEGDYMLKSYTNEVYPNCLKLEDLEEIRNMGYIPPSHSGIVTNSEMLTKYNGWGIGVVWNEQDAIHTYWEDSPGDPEPPTSTDPPKSGDCAMVKSYYIEYRKNGRLDHYENKGTYYQKDCTNVISIDDEPNYKLEKWKISSSEANTGIEATNNARRKTWNPPSATQSGTSPALKTLQGDEQVVYVLLKKVVEETVTPTPSDINYTLKESQITKRIKLSEQDGAALATNIKDHRFKWTIVAHATQCSGHTVSRTPNGVIFFAKI